MCAICCQLLWNILRGIEMVSVCTGLLGEEGRVSTSVDTRLQTEYLLEFLIFKYEKWHHLSHHSRNCTLKNNFQLCGLKN